MDSRGASPSQSCFSQLLLSARCIFPSDLCPCVFFAAAEWKSATAGLKPGSPQNLLPCHLALNIACNCVVVWMSTIRRLPVCEGISVSLHSFGSLLKDFSILWLSIWGQWAGLWGIGEKVIQQRWVVVRHMFSMAQTDLSVIASAGSRGRKVGSEKVHFEDGVTWMETHTREHAHLQYILRQVKAQ